MLAPHGRTDEHWHRTDGRTDEHYVGTARTDRRTLAPHGQTNIDGRTDEHYVGTARTDEHYDGRTD